MGADPNQELFELNLGGGCVCLRHVEWIVGHLQKGHQVLIKNSAVGGLSLIELGAELALTARERGIGLDRTWGQLKREDYPTIKTAAKDTAAKSMVEIFREDFERKHPIRDVVAEALHTGIEEARATVDQLLPACDCGAKPGDLHFQFCPQFVK